MPIARACDRCHKRRIKCDGTAPCQTCTKRSAACTYEKPVLRKGPKPRGLYDRSAPPAIHLSVAQQSTSPADHSLTISNKSSPTSTKTSPQNDGAISPHSSGGPPMHSEGGGAPDFKWPPVPGQDYIDADEAWRQAMSALDGGGMSELPQTSARPDDVGNTSGIHQQPAFPLQLALLGSLPLSRILANGNPSGDDTLLPQQHNQPGPSREPHQHRAAIGWQDDGSELIEVGWGMEIAEAVAEWGSATGEVHMDAFADSRPIRQPFQTLDGTHVGTSVVGRWPNVLSSCDNILGRSDVVQQEGEVGAATTQAADNAIFPAGTGLDLLGSTVNADWGNGSSARPLGPSGCGKTALREMENLSATHDYDNLSLSGNIAYANRSGQGGIKSSSMVATGPARFAMPREIDMTPPGHTSPLFSLVLDTLIYPQMDIFMNRTYPMIPVYNARYLKSRFVADENKDRMAMMMAMSALSLVHPLTTSELASGHHRAKQAATLIEEALRIRCRFDFGDSPTLESIMTSYLIFGALFEMGHSAGASLRLREAIAQGETMGLNDPSTYQGLDQVEMQRRLRVYWILAITERAYALQRKGNILLDGSIITRFDVMTRTARIEFADNDPISQSLQLLAQLFSFVSRSVTKCWNYRCDPNACHDFSLPRTVAILARLELDGPELFGGDYATRLAALTESQKADFLITWQWLRSRVWRSAALHDSKGKGASNQLGAQYVVDVVQKAAGICQSLSLSSMEAHGTGFVEKLYDIACTAAVALRRSTTSSRQRERLLNLLGDMYTCVLLYKRGSSEFAGRLAIEIDSL